MTRLEVRAKRVKLQSLRDLLLILVVGLFIYCYKLGDSPLDRTEPHRALVAHQMVQSGDWLVPRLFGELYLRKPPLIYWIQAGTEKLFGVGNEFVWRFPSALGSALLAVALAAWSSRWFGRAARLPAGIACLALLALWDQDRGADIDALNTVASVVTTMIVLEIMYGPSATERRSAPFGTPPEEGGVLKHTLPSEEMKNHSIVSSIIWAILLAVSLAATLLLKGPSGFPPILGALIGPALLLRNWKPLRRPGVWIGLALGIATFVAYAAIAKSRIRSEGLQTDTAGLQEALQRMVLHNIHDLLPAATAPLLTILYALPVSLVLLYLPALVKQLPRGNAARERILALLGTFVAALLIWILAGNKNPRYEYVALPLLAPLVGAVGAAYYEGQFAARTARSIRFALTGSCVLFVIAQLFFLKKLLPIASEKTGLIVAAGVSVFAFLAVLTGTGAAIQNPKSKFQTLLPLALIALLAVPMAMRKNMERRKKSAANTARQLHDLVMADSSRLTPVGVASMIRDMPELFYYAHIPVQAFGEQHLADLAASAAPRWVVLADNDRFPEYTTVLRDIPNAFPHGATKLNMPDAHDKVYVGWYEPPAGSPRALHLIPRISDSASAGADD